MPAGHGEAAAKDSDEQEADRYAAFQNLSGIAKRYVGDCQLWRYGGREKLWFVRPGRDWRHSLAFDGQVTEGESC